jgi:hypothetical protein
MKHQYKPRARHRGHHNPSLRIFSRVKEERERYETPVQTPSTSQGTSQPITEDKCHSIPVLTRDNWSDFTSVEGHHGKQAGVQVRRKPRF